MAERRMFSKEIIDSDAFLDMPLSTQALYFHLCMRADDDGFVNNPKKIQRMIGCSDDDGKVLIGKKFIIPFENGVVVIKHWRIHNYIQKDRYHATKYEDEMAMLTVKQNGAYTVLPDESHHVSNLDTECIQDVSRMDTEVSIGKVSLDKVSLGKVSKGESEGETPAQPANPPKRFVRPTLEEVRSYCAERHNAVDPDRFFAYYEANGWSVGKRSMKDWKAAIRYWETDPTRQPQQPQRKGNYFAPHDVAPVIETDETDITEEEEEELMQMLRGGKA